MVEVGQGGTEQARYEREVIYEQVLNRLSQLQMGDASLVFGRIDQGPEAGGESYYIGRLGVWDRNQDPVVVDWRAPIAEAFYRATGGESFGLERRRHFATRGRTLLAIEDELFGDLTRLDAPEEGAAPRLAGQGALIAALEAARTGRLSDIVATTRVSRTRSSARPCRVCSCARGVLARVRRSSRCTAPRTCCTRIVFRLMARACSSWGRTGSSLRISNKCCRHSAKPASK